MEKALHIRLGRVCAIVTLHLNQSLIDHFSVKSKVEHIKVTNSISSQLTKTLLVIN